jgi:hypothetical protein
MPFIHHLNLRVPVRSPTLIGLNFPLVALVSIIGRRKILTYTQDTTRAKLERLLSARLTRHDHKDHESRHARLQISKGLIILLTTIIRYY